MKRTTAMLTLACLAVTTPTVAQGQPSQEPRRDSNGILEAAARAAQRLTVQPNTTQQRTNRSALKTGVGWLLVGLGAAIVAVGVYDYKNPAKAHKKGEAARYIGLGVVAMGIGFATPFLFDSTSRVPLPTGREPGWNGKALSTAPHGVIASGEGICMPGARC